MVHNNQEEAVWGKTNLCLERLMEQGELEFPDGRPHYKGRHIIGHDTPVLEGVYLGASKREAIVVHDSDRLNELYRLAKSMATRDGKVRREYILQSVYDAVRHAMPIHDDEIANLIVKHLGCENDGKISLDVFLKSRVGVCRHKALACAALLEKFKNEGYLKGSVSVDRNETSTGAHAWCRYTTSNGDVIILDISNDFFGYLKDGLNKWPYARPGERV